MSPFLLLSPSTHIVSPVTRIDDLPHELSAEENLMNFKAVQRTHDREGVEDDDEALSTEDEFDVELGTGKLLPMRRASVMRVVVRRRNSIPAPTMKVVSSLATPLRPPTFNLLASRATKIAETPAPAIPRAPPLIPEKSPKRDGMLVESPLTSHRLESIARPDSASPSPPPLPPRSLKWTIVPIPAQGLGEELIVLAPPPLKRATILAPAPLRIGQKSAVSHPTSKVERKFSLYSESEYGDDEDGDVGEEEDPEFLEQFLEMVRAYHAGTLFFPPSPVNEEEDTRETEFELAWQLVAEAMLLTAREDKETTILKDQRELFGVSEDGVSWRNPFVQEPGVSAEDLGELMPVLMMELGKARNTSEESIEMAISDESIFGSEETPKISPGTKEDETPERAERLAEVARVHARGEYDYIGAESWPLDKEGEEIEDQGEITNPHSGQFAPPEGEWTVLMGERSLSRSSVYSVLSRLPSPVLRNRSRETLLYSPVANPWHPEVMAELNEILESNAPHAASEISVHLDVEALVADAQELGYELADTDPEKGSADHFDLEPHEPEIGCGCHHCHKHYRPTKEDLKMVHDSNEWCYCLACRDFREKSEKKKRAEQAAFWTKKFDELAAEVGEAKAEEESKLLDLTDSKAEEEDPEGCKPKKTHRLGDWVRRHLRCPNSGE